MQSHTILNDSWNAILESKSIIPLASPTLAKVTIIKHKKVSTKMQKELKP